MVATNEDKNAASVFRDPGPGECGRMNGRHREGAVEDQQEKLKRHRKAIRKSQMSESSMNTLNALPFKTTFPDTAYIKHLNKICFN